MRGGKEMGEKKLEAGNRVEAVERPPGRQTIPVGTKATVKFLHPEHEGLVFIQTDAPVKAIVPKGSKGTDRQIVLDNCFFVMAEEIRKI